MALKKSIYITPIAVAVVFVTFGDQIKFLPSSVQVASFKTRTEMKQYLAGIFSPDGKYNANEKRLEEMNQIEQGQLPSQ